MRSDMYRYSAFLFHFPSYLLIFLTLYNAMGRQIQFECGTHKAKRGVHSRGPSHFALGVHIPQLLYYTIVSQKEEERVR